MSGGASGNGRDEQLDTQAGQLIELAQRALGPMSPVQHERGRAVLRARRADHERRRLFGRRVVFSLGTAAVAALAVVGLSRLRPDSVPASDRPLTYAVEGGALQADGVIQPRAGADAGSALRFADGTVIALQRGTRGRLTQVDGRGARVAIEDGAAHVDVVHKPQARWFVDAGPFSITVHGTTFTASWNKAQARLEVRMERGLVSVSGPIATGPVAVRGGQRLTVSLRESQIVLSDLNAEAPERGEGPAEAPSLEHAPAAAPRAGAETRTKPARARPARNWAAALSAGDFDAVLADAQVDLARALASRSSDDLAALADAARYRRHDDLARRALHAQRRRFTGSSRAADAAFFLGRLDENVGRRGRPHALGWYEQYLDEAPNGSYAAEALGRKMMAIRELDGVAAARSVAEQYVRRFPQGSYAGAAQAIRVER